MDVIFAYFILLPFHFLSLHLRYNRSYSRVCFNVQYTRDYSFDFNLIPKPFPVVLMEGPIG